MADIQYKVTQITSETGVYLRDYTYSIEEGTCTLKENEMIGYELNKNAEVHVIDPLVYSEDKRWIQVMNPEGGTGFIPVDSIDVPGLNQKLPKTLDTPYYYFMLEDAKIEYEERNGIRSYPKDRADVAREAKTTNDKVGAVLKQFLTEERNDLTEEQILDGNRSHPKNPDNKVFTKAFFEYAKKKGETISAGVLYRYDREKESYEKWEAFKDGLEADGVKVTYEKSNQCIKTNLTRNEDLQYRYGFGDGVHKLNIEADLDAKYINASQLVNHDKNMFKFANRAYAEKSATERYLYKKEIQKREASRDYRIPAKLSDTEKVSKLNRDAENFTNAPSDFFRNQVEAHGGFLLGESHDNTVSRDWLKEHMGALKNAGVNTIYIEHFFPGANQRMIDRYLDKGELSDALNKFLSTKDMEGFKALLEAAKENHVRIVGIGSELAQTDTKESIDHKRDRALLFNQAAAKKIKNDQDELDKDQRGFVVLAGEGHLCMHEGYTQDTPIAGLSQLLEMEAIELSEDKKLARFSDQIVYGDQGKREKIDVYCDERGIVNKGQSMNAANKPSRGDRIRAFFGNTEAKQKIQNYHAREAHELMAAQANKESAKEWKSDRARKAHETMVTRANEQSLKEWNDEQKKKAVNNKSANEQEHPKKECVAMSLADLKNEEVKKSQKKVPVREPQEKKAPDKQLAKTSKK